MLFVYNQTRTIKEALTEYKDLKIERELSNSDVTLSFSYPQLSSKYNLLQEESFIRTQTEEFVIKEVNEGDLWTEIIAKVNVDALEGQLVPSIESKEATIADALNYALIGTGWTVGTNNVTKKRTISKTNCSAFDVINEARDLYRCDIVYDTLAKKVNIFATLGTDKGAYFMEGLNLKDLSSQRNSHTFYTRIVPVGKDGLDIKKVNGNNNYIDNNSYSSKVKTFYWEDNRYTDAQSLKDDATLKLEELSKPYVAYSTTVIDLSAMSGTYSMLDYTLGDIVTVISKEKKVKQKLRIVKMTEYPEEPEKNTCELGSMLLSFEKKQKEDEKTIDVASKVTTSDGNIDSNKIPVLKGATTVNTVDKDGNLVVTNLNAINIKVGTIEATYIKATDISADNATFKKVVADTIKAGAIEARSIVADQIQAHTITANEIATKTITANEIATGTITAGSGIIANGAIGNALISNLDAGKINAGTLSTNNVTICSDSGGIKIAGETQQWYDENNKVRMIAGRDAQNKFVFGVFDETGTGVLIDSTGVKEKALAEGIIKTDMIAKGAITGQKLDYSSFTAEWNKDTNTSTLKSSKILMDDNQSLSISFNTLTTKVGDVEKKVTYSVEIISTNGDKFKNGIFSTKLIAIVRNGPTDVTSTIDSNRFRWTRLSLDPVADQAWNTSHFGGAKEITITQTDVLHKATFQCDILE